MCASSFDRHSARARKGFVLPTAAFLFILAIPMVGLAIDLGLTYMIQSKVQAAADAASLAAVRSLSRGNNDDAQKTSAKNTAKAYLAANFPSGFMGTATPVVADPDVQNLDHSRTVKVDISVDIPRLFLRWFGTNSINVKGTSTATRRDVNVVVVMDRSGSLANSMSCTPLKAAAADFVNKFAEARDNVGLVTFASSSRVDFALASNFKTASLSVASIMNSVNCSGATNTAQGLWQGYQALATLNQPAALNVIVFFTDGQPTAITAQMQSKGGCNPANVKTGVFTVGFNSSGNPVATGGVFDYQAPAQPMSSDMTIIPAANGGSAGCSFAPSWPNNWTSGSNDVNVPTTDLWGNNLTNGYQPVTVSGSYVSVPSNSTGASNMINASTNAADDAAARIRAEASPGAGLNAVPGVIVFSIGLGNSNFPANHEFLKRVANTTDSSSHTSAAPDGLYIYCPTSDDLSDAFNRIASEILRLAK